MKGTIYYVAIIAMVIFSHVKISSFRAKAHLVFHWCFYNKNVKMGSVCSMYGQTLSLVYPPVPHVVFDKQDVQQ